MRPLSAATGPASRSPASADDATSVAKGRYGLRAGIEGTLSQGVRAFGMRRSRYIGRAKTGLQQVCTATAMNVVRIVNWLGGTPRAETRVTRFAALAHAA